jgi:hypothetical protein
MRVHDSAPSKDTSRLKLNTAALWQGRSSLPDQWAYQGKSIFLLTPTRSKQNKQTSRKLTFSVADVPLALCNPKNVLCVLLGLKR